MPSPAKDVRISSTVCVSVTVTVYRTPSDITSIVWGLVHSTSLWSEAIVDWVVILPTVEVAWASEAVFKVWVVSWVV